VARSLELNGLPSDVQVESFDAHETRYVLPVREPSVVARVGRVLAGLGALGLAIPLAWILVKVVALLQHQAVDLTWGMAILFSLPEIFLAHWCLFIGLCLLYGHSEIEIRDERLWAIERVGFWLRRRSCRLAEVTELAVACTVGEKQSFAWLTKLAVLRAGGEKNRLWLAPGYSPDLCRALAADLSARLMLAGGPKVAILEEAPFASLSQQGNPYPHVDRREPPAGSKVVVEQLPSGVTLNVPAMGLRGTNLALFIFGIVWSFLTVGFTVVAINSGGGGIIPPLMYLAFVAFDLVGVAMIVFAVLQSRIKIGLAAVDGRLMMLQLGWRKIEREWPPGEIQSVDVGPSNLKMNDQPVPELQIVGADGRKCGLMGGRPVAELEWIATLLRDALKLPKSGGAEYPADGALPKSV
jgi:hypothetical protein